MRSAGAASWPARGHRVLVLAPSRSPELVRESRRLIRRARAPSRCSTPDGGVRVLGVGELLPLAPARRGAAAGAAARHRAHDRGGAGARAARLRARARAVRAERRLGRAAPLAGAQRRLVPRARPSACSRPRSRAASSSCFFGRLDARTASFDATRELMERFFPARYRLLRPGADAAPSARAAATGRVRIAFCDHEERQALRLFLRALRRLPDELDWQATVLHRRPGARTPRAAQPPARPRHVVRRRRRDRGRRARRAPTSSSPPRSARRPRPGCSCARSAPARCRSPRGCPSTRRCCATATLGLLFEPGDVDVLAAQLERLIARRRAARAARRAPWPRPRPSSSWARVADERRGDLRRARRAPPPAARRRRAARAARHAPADRRRPAHAHRPLERLRDAGRGAARHGARARPRRDRGDRPQRDLRRARRARQGGRVRRQGDRRRGGQDRRPGRGDRPLHRGEDPARDDARGDDRRDPPPGRARLRPAPVRPHALRARLRAPARRRRRRRRDRGLQPADRDPGLQRGGGALRRQVPDRRRRRLGRARRAGPRLACGSGCATSTGPEEFLESLRDADIVGRPSSLLLRAGPGAEVPPDAGHAAGRPRARRASASRAARPRARNR